jgi:hypothetical protein
MEDRLKQILAYPHDAGMGLEYGIRGHTPPANHRGLNFGIQAGCGVLGKKFRKKFQLHDHSV